MMLQNRTMFASTARYFLPVCVVVLILGGIGNQLFGAEVPLTVSKLSIEYDPTSQSAGLQIQLNGQAWKKMAITAPNGKMFALSSKKNLANIGLTDFSIAGGKSDPTQIPLDQFLTMFPEGEYKFKGKAVNGDDLTGTATLTHMIPDGPAITAPAADATVDPSNTVITWDPVTTPAGVDIVSYRVTVQEDTTFRYFSVDLTKFANSLRLPSKFLQATSTYTAKVLAIDAGGNQTLSEVSFNTP
jgi:fibronectin type III domain protein